ncbi:putative ubiquitin carboxyl-terminal hydrolase FAF-X, partial [Frankliniella fusca]
MSGIKYPAGIRQTSLVGGVGTLPTLINQVFNPSTLVSVQIPFKHIKVFNRVVVHLRVFNSEDVHLPSATESIPCNTPATLPSSLQTPSVSTTSRPSPLSVTDSTPHNPPTTITNPLSQLQSPSTTSSPPSRPSSPPASKSSDSPPQSVVAAASFPSSTHPTVSTKPSITPLPLKSTSPLRKRLRSSRRAKSEDQVIPLDDSSDSNEQADPLYQYGGSGKHKKNNKKTDKRRTKKQTKNWREDMSLFNTPPPLPGPSQKFNKSSQLSSFDVKFERIMFHNSSLDDKFVKRILSGVLEEVNVHWDDVCGLEHVKQRLK